MRDSIAQPEAGADATLSERALIGALLTDFDAVYPIVQAAGIGEASFSDPICLATWRAMETLRAAHKIIDLVSVPEAMSGDAAEIAALAYRMAFAMQGARMRCGLGVNP